MDRFMLQNITRCLIVPFQKYSRGENPDFHYFLHTYFRPDVLGWVGMMRDYFPFESITIHDRAVVLREKHEAMEASLFLQDYSLHRVKKKWRHVDGIDLVVLIRLDLLLTKSLSESDIVLVLSHQRHLFLHHEDKPFFAIADPVIMNVFVDQLRHFAGDHSFLDIMRIQYNIKIQCLSLVFVRILPEAIVCPEDYHVCPYLGDLIASSSTKIRLVKRKNSLKS